jgi:aminopeptidase N
MTVPQHWAVAHELAHQWWYGLVGDDQWHAPWLDESFATFAERRLDGDFGDCRPSAPFAGAGSPLPLTASMASFEQNAPAYEAVVYRGGSCALQALRLAFGDTRFDALLRGLVAGHRDGILTTAVVVAAVRAAAPPGFDLAAWLRHARLPAPR